MFFAAKPREETVFDALRREAAQMGDVVVLPAILEHYHNISHQTLEILRVAATFPDVTHVLKARIFAYLDPKIVDSKHLCIAHYMNSLSRKSRWLVLKAIVNSTLDKCCLRTTLAVTFK